MKSEIEILDTHEAPVSTGLKFSKKNTNRETAAHINDILDYEGRRKEFEQSLLFSQKIMISDDGNLVTQSRVVIPETIMISHSSEEYKKKKQEEDFNQTDDDNGVLVHVTNFDLNEEGEDFIC